MLKYAAGWISGGTLAVVAAMVLLPPLGAPTWLTLMLVFAAVLTVPVMLAWHWSSLQKDAQAGAEQSGEVWFLDRPIPTVTGRPSIAIMALESDEPQTVLMGLGLSGEVINILTQEANIFVIAGNSSLSYRGRDVDLQEVAAELGVSYILTGSIGIKDQVAQIAISLWDARTKETVWSEELTYTQDRIFEFPVEAVAKVGTSITGQFVSWDPAHISYARPPDVASWLKYVEAKEAFRIDEPRGYKNAETLARGAAESAPEFGRAQALWAQVLAVTVSQSLSRDQEFDAEMALEASNAAIQLTHGNHEALAQVARSFLHLGQHARAQQIAADAETKLPDSGPIAAILAFCNLSFGRAELAIFNYGRALRLSPKDDEVSSWLVAVGICHLILGHHDAAIAHLNRAVEMSPQTFLFWHILANTYGLAGRIREGQEALAHVYELLPSFSVEIAEHQWRIMFADASSADLLTAGHERLTADATSDPQVSV